jgi:nucleoside-diphosphate-sugar epimerase
MTCYIVLGASGFLGSHVHEAINRSEEAPALVAVSRYPPLLAMPPNSSWVPLDLVTATVAELVVLIEASRPDAVINCAGRTSGTSQQLWDLNTTFVDKLIQALRQSGPAPLVHLGSAAEYGVQPSGIPIKETADARPVSSYGRSKLAATRKIASAAEKGDISATVLRVFNPIGPRMPVDTLAGRAVQQLRLARQSKGSVITMGPLDAFRDFIAAKDVASAALRATQLPGRDPVINVGRGVSMSCRTLVQMIADAAGFRGNVVEQGDGSGRSAEVPWQQADVSLLGLNFDWLPETTMIEAVLELWKSDSELPSRTNGEVSHLVR